MKKKTIVSVCAAVLALLMIGSLALPRQTSSSGVSLHYLGSKAYPGGATARYDGNELVSQEIMMK